ncbi:MAG: hypothetical protein SGPRY_005950, partial [Prymnesium sp.]
MASAAPRQAPSGRARVYRPSPITWGERGLPPSIPVPDMAWGYEVSPDGSLSLKAPSAPSSSPGPGSYDPMLHFTQRSTPATNFKATTGRTAALLPSTSPVSTLLAPGGYDGATSNPRAAKPRPSHFYPARRFSPMQERANYAPSSHPPHLMRDLGPGVYEPPPGVGHSMPVGSTLPRQRRYTARSDLPARTPSRTTSLTSTPAS